MKAKDIMKTDVPCVLPDTPLSSVLALIVKREISVAAVSNEHGALLGIVSQGDILRRNDDTYRSCRGHWMSQVAPSNPVDLERLNRLHVKDRNVVEIMSRPVVCVDADAELPAVLDTLLAQGIKQALVTTNARLTGVVTRDDIMQALMPTGMTHSHLPLKRMTSCR